MTAQPGQPVQPGQPAQPGQRERRNGPARSGPARKQPAAGDQPAGEPPAADMPYEQARDELIEVVQRLEGGGLTLEESLELWERGEHLAAICSQWLEGARARLAAALPAHDGPGDSAAPF